MLYPVVSLYSDVSQLLYLDHSTVMSFKLLIFPQLLGSVSLADAGNIFSTQRGIGEYLYPDLSLPQKGIVLKIKFGIICEHL